MQGDAGGARVGERTVAQSSEDDLVTTEQHQQRDPKDDADARRWSHETRRRAEHGELSDDSDYLAAKIAEETGNLEHR